MNFIKYVIIGAIAIYFSGCGTQAQKIATFTIEESKPLIAKMSPNKQSDIVYLYSYLDYPYYVSCNVNGKPTGRFDISGSYQILRLKTSSPLHVIECERHSYDPKDMDPNGPLGTILIPTKGNTRHFIEIDTKFTPFQEFFMEKKSGETFDINNLQLTKECFDCY